MAKILDGKPVSNWILTEVKSAVRQFQIDRSPIPGLATVQVGKNSRSKALSDSKRIVCEEVGVYFEEHNLPEDAKEDTLISRIEELNRNRNIHGINVQLPLPAHISESTIFSILDHRKDVDGFHPNNFGKLFSGEAGFIPCTPAGVILLLKKSEIPMSGKNALVIGRSNNIGKPLALLLLRENATVTIAHTQTANLIEEIGRAEILCSAIGKPHFVKGEWIRPNAVVVDIGTNFVDAPAKAKGYVLRGDVDFESAKDRAGFITPLPGGVGPVTISMLISNTLQARNLLEKDKHYFSARIR